MDQSLVSIPQAAEILKVSTKTIRNYISRSFLDASLWNGAWRISRESIVEIYEKKFGIRLIDGEVPNSEAPGSVTVPRSEFADLQQKAGRLQVAETLAVEHKREIQQLNERIAQTEASAASAWTETRTQKDQLGQLREGYAEVENLEKALREEVAWLRREFDRLKGENADLRSENERLEQKLEALGAQVHLKAIGM